eukprot:CAMPEP_0184385208 /NCGR_PEP_ID=MMETSP0007-20130409/8615_1 /TAXON_ID=97485 /ORGANISM="Prymnesium parvum, Strain Texoma1" /LENGTH=56 /DNA_ID=CAMNT_0026732433 /DNA_START=306 /DNA_END=474 /DNA_ORIENTATION=-
MAALMKRRLAEAQPPLAPQESALARGSQAAAGMSAPGERRRRRWSAEAAGGTTRAL